MHHQLGISTNAYRILRPWTFILFGVLLSAAFFVFSPVGLGPKLIGMIMLWGFAVAACRGDLSHPYVWFGFFYLLYAISGPLLIYLQIHPYMFNSWGGREITTLDFDFVLQIEYLCFVVFVLLVGPMHVDISQGVYDRLGRVIADGAPLFLFLALALVSISLLDVYLHGYQNKAQITLQGSWVTRLSFAYNLVVIGAVVVLYKYLRENRISRAYLLIGAMILFGLVAIFISGQRNFLFRFLIAAFFVIHLLHRRFNLTSALALTLPALTVIFVLGELKNIWQVIDHHSGSFDQGVDLLNLGLLAKFPHLSFDDPVTLYSKLTIFTMLGNEFMTASNNLALVVERVPRDLAFLEGQSLFYDISRVVAPGFIVGGSIPNTMQIYHEAFFPELVESGVGPGFSILGAGYMNFGVFGAVFVMIALSLVLRFLYRAASRGSFGFFFYLAFMPIASYSVRTDLSAPISQGLKHVLLPLLVMIAIAYLGRRSETATRPDGLALYRA